MEFNQDDEHQNPTFSGTISRIKGLVSKDNIGEAILALRQYDHDRTRYNELITLEARLVKLERDYNLGVLTYADFTAHRNRVRVALIAFLDDFEDRTEAHPDLLKRQQKVYQLLNLAKQEMLEQHFDIAISIIEQCQTILPGHADSLYLLGACRLGQERYQEAEYIFREYLDQTPNQPFAMYNLALVYLLLDRKPDSCYLWNRLSALGFSHLCEALIAEHCH